MPQENLIRGENYSSGWRPLYVCCQLTLSFLLWKFSSLKCGFSLLGFWSVALLKSSVKTHHIYTISIYPMSFFLMSKHIPDFHMMDLKQIYNFPSSGSASEWTFSPFSVWCRKNKLTSNRCWRLCGFSLGFCCLVHTYLWAILIACLVPLLACR